MPRKRPGVRVSLPAPLEFIALLWYNLVMEIYHYTSLDDWPGIKHGSWKSQELAGLGLHRRVCVENYEDEGARNGAVFGLTGPQPDDWVNNNDFPFAWRSLMRNTGRLLLTYEINDKILNNSHVIDWSHMERMLGGHKDDIGNEERGDITNSDRVAAERLYWASRVPLGECIDNPGLLREFILPEVITTCHVPFDLIKVADVQPKLQDMPPYLQEDLERMIGIDPELEALSAYLRAT